MWTLYYTKQAQKDARKLASAGLPDFRDGKSGKDITAMDSLRIVGF